MTGKCLNILYVGTLIPHPGGSAVSSSQLLVGFATAGHRIRALAPITKEALHVGDRFAARHSMIDVTRFVMPYFETAPNYPAAASYRQLEGKHILEQLPRLISNERPDILFMGRETFAWHVPDCARAHRLPCILRTAGGTTIGVLQRTYPEALAQQLLGQYRKADLIVTPAKHMAECLRQLGCCNVKIIPNAIDLHQFVPRPKPPALIQQLGLRDGELVVMHISNLKALKRPLDIVYSAEATLRHMPNLTYVIVGDGPCRQSMEEACEQKRIAERFKFVGWVEYDCVPDYINLADMVVMPAEAETQARVYLETQACGRLLLASDIPGAQEVVADGKTGLLFRVGDIADMAAKILSAARDPMLRAAIGRKAQEQVQTHALDTAVATYVATFEEVIRCHQLTCTSLLPIH